MTDVFRRRDIDYGVIFFFSDVCARAVDIIGSTAKQQKKSDAILRPGTTGKKLFVLYIRRFLRYIISRAKRAREKAFLQ